MYDSYAIKLSIHLLSSNSNSSSPAVGYFADGKSAIGLHGEPLKTCHFLFDCNSGISCAILTIFVPMKTGILCSVLNDLMS